MNDFKRSLSVEEQISDMKTAEIMKMVNNHANEKRGTANIETHSARLTAPKGTAKRANERNRKNRNSWKKKAVAAIMAATVIVGGITAINDNSQRVHSAEDITSISVLKDLGTSEETRNRLIEIRTDVEQNENITMEQLEDYIYEIENIKLNLVKGKIENATSYDKSQIHISAGDQNFATRIMLGEKEYNEMTGEYQFPVLAKPETIQVPKGTATSDFVNQIVGMQITQQRLERQDNPYSEEELKEAIEREIDDTLGYIPVEVATNEKNEIVEDRMLISDLEKTEKEELIEFQNIAYDDKDEGR